MEKKTKKTSNAQKVGAIALAFGLATSAVATLLPENSLAELTGAETVKITDEMIENADFCNLEELDRAKTAAKNTRKFNLAAALDAGIVRFKPYDKHLIPKSLKGEMEKIKSEAELDQFSSKYTESFEATSYKELLEFLKDNDFSLEDVKNIGYLTYDHNRYHWWGSPRMNYVDGKIEVEPFGLLYDIDEFKNLPYERMNEYLLNIYDKDIEFAPTIINNTGKNHFTYPNGIDVRILDDGTVVKTEKDGSAKTYTPGLCSTLHVYDYNGNALIVWESNVDCEKSTLGGVYRMITPTGEMHEKIFLNCYATFHLRENDWAYAIKSSCGTTAYFNGTGYLESTANYSLDAFGDQDIMECEGENGALWIDYPYHGKGEIVQYKPSEVKNKISYESLNGIIYDEVAICNLNNSNYNRFYGEATRDGEYTIITWNDGKKDYLLPYGGDSHWVPTYDLLRPDGVILDKGMVKVEYPNGRSLEVDEETGVLIKQDGELIGTINISFPDSYFPNYIYENTDGDINITLNNGDNLLISEGKEYCIYGPNSKSYRRGVYEGGSLVDISLSNEELGFENGVFEIIKGVEKEKGSKHLPMRDLREKQKQYNSVSKVKLKALKRGRF